MREIKFRAWDERTKTMFYDVCCRETDKLMQFTGLHDKNGKEIWEGDIVKQKPSFFHDEIQVVEYQEGFFEPFRTGEQSPDIDSLEVIGNIHENSELLNGGNSERD